MAKKGERKSFAKRVMKGIRNILLEKYTFSIALLVVLVLAFMFSSGSAYASPIKTNASVIWDTEVQLTNPNTNYGGQTTINVRDYTTKAERTYAMFDLSAFTNLTRISNAKACFYLSSDGTTSNTSIYTVRVGGLNLETTMTYNNQPCGSTFNNATACNLTAQSEQVTTGVQYICWNVSFITQAVVDKNLSNITFALKSPETDVLTVDNYNSREASGFFPYMEITSCQPNWVLTYTTCGTNLNSSCGTYLNKTLYYTDTNACGSIRGLPSNNGTCVACNSPPVVSFYSQVPAQITNFNLYNQTLNITYSISDLDNNLNLSTIKLFFKLNNTGEDLVSYINGTPINQFQIENYSYNISSNFLFNLDADEVFAGTFNYPQDNMENTQHQNISLFLDELLAIEILNITTTKSYGLFEIMMNRTPTTLSSSVFYCNSSYDFASNPLLNENCHKFGVLNSTNFHHNHTIYSSHQILPFAVNTTSGAISSVMITSKSYFIVEGAIGTWNAYYINNKTRTNVSKFSVDDGSTWVEQNFTVDAHLHQFSTINNYLYYYACANDTNSNQTCSSTQQQIIKLEQTNPTAPFIISPLSNTYSGIVSINYTEALSPFLNAIVNYSIYLFNPDETFNSTIISNNGVNLGYLWNSSTVPDGNYKIRVMATDNMSLSSFDISELFTIQNCFPNWSVQYTTCGSTINASCTGFNNRTKYYIDTNNCNHIATLPSDNNTCSFCDYCLPSWFCGSLDTCSNFWKNCLYISPNNATNYGTCCAVTNYTSDCNFTGDLNQFNQICGNMVTTISVNPDYPYLDCNTTATWHFIITINNTRQNFEHLYISFPLTSQVFNWTWNNATQQYDINLYFTEGDYPYIIWSDFPYGVMPNITGTLKVRCPYDICLQGFYLNPKNETNSYKNIHAYATAEFEDEVFVTNWHRTPYDKTLEQYLRPLDFKGLFKTKVFHAQYINGEACIKLWERNKTYAFRILDGEMTFPDGVYSKLNATRMYGAFLFLGTVKTNGTDETYKFYFTEQELHPYKVLFNWMFVIGLILILVIAGVLAVFVHPMIAYYFGIVMVVIAIILRIMLWFAIG